MVSLFNLVSNNGSGPLFFFSNQLMRRNVLAFKKIANCST